MTHTLRRLLFAATAVLLAVHAEAREIDTEKTVTTEQIQLGQALPKTLVVRMKEGSAKAEVLHLNEVLKGDEVTKQLVSTSSFVQLDAKGRMPGELDRDSSTSSWHFYCPGYSNPYYTYCGYNYPYTPYYRYYYGGYYYYYYGWSYYNPYCR